MNTSALLAFAHHLAAFTLVAAITVELVLIDRTLSHGEARRIQRADMVYGISAGALVVVGFLRVFYFEKGSAYYFHNVFFIVKLSLFLLVALLSIYPTVLFLSWNKLLKAGRPPQSTDVQFRRLRTILLWELLGVIGILLCAPFMARASPGYTLERFRPSACREFTMQFDRDRPLSAHSDIQHLNCD